MHSHFAIEAPIYIVFVYFLACKRKNWYLAFDNEGWVYCDGRKEYVAGLYRSNGDELSKIEEAVCCPLPLAYAQDGDSCRIARWWGTFGT